MLRVVLAVQRCRRGLPAVLRHSVRGRAAASSSRGSTPLSTPTSAASAGPSSSLEASRVVSQPPLPVRLALVGSSVVLATPAFTLAGMYRAWTATNVIPEVVKKGVAIVVGGSTFSLFYNYIIPNLLEYSHIILPFAVSNGIACMVWQGIGEAAFGINALATLTFFEFQGKYAFLQRNGLINKLLKGMTTMPASGAVIGVLASLTAPFLWPVATKLCWTPDMREFLLGGDDMTWLMDTYFKIVIPVGIPVGFLSGLSLHHLLQPVVLGIEGTPWYMISLPALAGVSLFCVLLYDTLLPGGSARSAEEFFWVRRLDPVKGTPVSVNLTTKEVVPTHSRAEIAELKMTAIETFHFLRRLRHVFNEWMMWSTSSDKNRTDISYSLENLPCYSKETKFKLKEIAEAENLFNLIDILVRYKHLEIEEQRQGGNVSFSIGAAREFLDAEAKQSLNLRNGGDLIKDLEKLCILRKAIVQDPQQHPSTSQSEAAVVARDIEKKVLSYRPTNTTSSQSFSIFGENSATSDRIFEESVRSLCERDSSPAVKGHRAISLLSQSSLKLLEEELEDKLNYVIKPLNEEDKVKLISDHKFESRMEYLQQGLVYLTYAAIPLIGCFALLRK